MSLAERLQQLNHEIGATLEKAFSELRHEIRQEITERFRASGDEVARKIEDFTPRLPSSFLDHEDLAPAAEELRSAATEARGAALGEIRDALAAIDRARSQAQILTALLEQSGRFASRAALLLLRAGEIHGWGGHGFAGADLRDLVLAPPPDSFWARLASAAPGASNQTGSADPGESTQQIATTHLSSGECASLCSLIESPVPQEGVVVPLVLRDRVVAALYADRLDGSGEDGSGAPPTATGATGATGATTAHAAKDGVLSVEALQVLTYAAAQAIESLPFRERSATSTLSIADQRDAGEASPQAAPAPQATAAPEAAAVSPGEPPAEPLHPASAAAAGSPGAATMATPVVAEAPPVPHPQLPQLPQDAESEIPEIEAEAETPQEAVADRGDETLDPWQPRREWRHEETAPESPAARHLESEQTAEMPLPALGEEGERPDEAARPTLQAVPILGPTPVPSASPAAGSVDSAGSAPPAGGRNETVLVPRTPFREADGPAAGVGAPPSSPAPWSAADTAKTPVTRPSAVPGSPEQGGSAAFEPLRPTPAVPATPEVRPPSGVQGPGWAFATTRVAVGSSEDALHEEARRLARLLVSEIKLYNEEQVEAGRRNRDLYERLREDIDRSRQMYEERVEPRLAKSTDYFYQELVRILAAGDSKALGI